MRNFWTTVVLICISLVSCSTTSTESPLFDLPELIPYNKKGKWGYCDKDKNIVVSCKYDYAELYDSFGLAQVFLTDQNNYNMYGNHASNVALIDKKGGIVVPFQSSDKFAYSVIPYDDKSDSVYGNYSAVRFGKYLIVLGALNTDLTQQKVFKKYVKGDHYYPKYIALDREGKRIIDDSFFYIQHIQNKDKVYYIIGEHKTTKQVSYFTSTGKRLNNLTFSKSYALDSNHFVGINMGPKRTILSSGIFTSSGKTIINGPYEIRNKIGNYVRINQRFYNYKLQKYVGTSFLYSHYHFRPYKDFIIAPIKRNDKLTFTILKHDLTPLYKGEFSKIEVDTTFKTIFMHQDNLIKIGNSKGDESSEIPATGEAEMISEGFCKVKIGNKYGLWSITEDRFVAPISYKRIEKMRENRFVLEDSAKMILIDRLGNYNSNDLFDKISWESNAGFRNDSLFYIYPNDDLTFVDYDTKYVFQYGNTLYYRIYRKNIGTNGEGQKLFAWNIKTSSFIEMDKIEFGTSFKFKNQKYVFIDKETSYNYKTGIVKSLTGVLDKNGNIAIEAKYQSIEYFPNFIMARIGNTYHIYNHDKENKLVLTLRLTLPTNTYFTQLNNDNGLIELLYDTKTNTKSKGYIDLYGTKYYE